MGPSTVLLVMACCWYNHPEFIVWYNGAGRLASRSACVCTALSKDASPTVGSSISSSCNGGGSSIGGSALTWGARGSKHNNEGSYPSSELKSDTSSYVLSTESSSEMIFITFGCSKSSVGSITPCVVGTVRSWTGVDVRSGVMGTSVGSGVEPTEVVAGNVASKENGSGVSGRGDGDISTSIGVGEAGSNGGIMSLSGTTSTEAAGTRRCGRWFGHMSNVRYDII